MNKKLIRLTEQDLHKIVKESVNKVVNEVYSGFHGGVQNIYEKDELDALYKAMDGVRNLIEKNEKLYKNCLGDEFNKSFYSALNIVVNALYAKLGMY